MYLSEKTIDSFRRRVFRHYENHGRVLPFRKTRDTYRITVSEYMLQQTQVDRVVPKYLSWILRWPSWRELAESSRCQVLTEWSGLGYNRRAIYLRETAKTVICLYNGRLPDSPSDLMSFPGIGRYTSRAILIFAHNRPLVAIDTNVRRVLIHELNLPLSVSMSEIESIAVRVLPKGQSRVWHYALMDYGSAVIPRQKVRIKPLSRQSPFEGSVRQIRGEIVRQLTRKVRVRTATIADALGRTTQDVMTAAQRLQADGIVRISKDIISLQR